MIPLNVDAITPLKTLLATYTGALPIYVNGGIPTVTPGNEFIAIDMNGGISSNATKFGSAQCSLAVSLYVKLLSTGAANTVRENVLIGQFQSLFANPANSTVSNMKFSYHLAQSPYIYSGKSLITGYSTKVLNVKCFINY